jgi:hypothetical protein
MTDLTRRDLLGRMAALPLASVLGTDVIERAAAAAGRALERQAATGQQFVPQFFTPEEWRTVRILVDIIMPRDARSGSATDAGVPEFMDFTLTDRPNMQSGMRSGLGWLDGECRRRFQQPFADCSTTQRNAVLDDIAWPQRARPEMADGTRFFTMFRDMTASGFWSSRMGVEDLQFMGNRVVPQWTGCSDAALRKLGVSYEDWDRRYGAG